MKIWDKDVLNKMAAVEFPDRRRKLTGEALDEYLRHLRSNRRTWCMLTMEEGDYSFTGALKQLAKLQHEHIEVNTTSGLTPIEPPTGAISVIYGDGGWNRWMVTFEGEVCFSRHHSTEEKSGLALQAGFQIW